MTLRSGGAYLLSGMVPSMWGNAHPTFGQPHDLAGVYLGSLVGTRTWHLFEIHLDRREVGVLLMNDTDLDRLVVTEVNGS